MKKDLVISNSQTPHYELPVLSPKHEQAENSRKIIKINDAIKSIMSIGKMQKMDLIAINNRSLFNYGKVKRAEWTNRRIIEQKSTFLPDLRSLKLDNRERSTKNSTEINHTEYFKLPIRQKRSLTKNNNTESDQIPQKMQICEQLIEEYIQKVKHQKKLNTFTNRQKLVEQACKEIQQKMIEIQNKKQVIQQKSNPPEPPKPKKSIKFQKQKRHRSITQAIYNENLNRVLYFLTKINKMSAYESKMRHDEQRLFLRRIKHSKRQSTHIY